MLIHVFTTGGTIDKVYFDQLSEFQVGDPQVQEVLKPIHPAFEFKVEALMRKDSIDLDDADRATIRARIKACDSDHILITHGTDSMRETARTLAGIAGKTIVLTGALAPARFKESDAVFNLGFAFACVQLLPPGVYLAMNGTVFDPFHVKKDRAKNIFEAEAEGGSN